MTDILIPYRLISIMMSRTDESICIVQRPDIRLMQLKNATRCALLYGIRAIKTEGNWEWNVTSVIVFGRARFIDDRSFWEDKLRKLTEKYYPSAEAVEAAMHIPSVNVVQMMAIDIEHMTGKLVNEK